MDRRMLISMLMVIFLAIAGKTVVGIDRYNEADPVHCMEFISKISDNGMLYSCALAGINSCGANVSFFGPVKPVKHTHSRIMCQSDSVLPVYSRKMTRQISDLMGTTQSLIVLEKLLL